MYMSLEGVTNRAVAVMRLEQHGEPPRGWRCTADRTITAHHRCVRRFCLPTSCALSASSATLVAAEGQCQCLLCWPSLRDY